MTDPLGSWAALNREVMKLTEEELAELLSRDIELPTQFVNRVYCRFSRLRRDRERREHNLPLREGAR